MRFYVRRTSNGYGDGGPPPIPEAIPAKVPRWDVRTFKSPEEFDARFGQEPWLSRGTDHRVLRGPRGGSTGICRRMGDEDGWIVEIDSLAALLVLVDKYGDLVLTHVDNRGAPDDPYQLEVYDSWRE